MTKNCIKLLLVVLSIFTLAYSDGFKAITFISQHDTFLVLNPKTEQINEQFRMQAPLQKLSCRMPELFIYEEYDNSEKIIDIHKYSLQSVGIQIQSVNGKYWDVPASINCVSNDCVVLIDNECELEEEQTGRTINWIVVKTAESQYDFQYLVNCHPETVYKPFEWGLFILICICTLTITLSSFYSRAWSYGGFGIDISYKFLIVFNFLVIAGSIIAYFLPSVTAIMLKIVGSIIGVIGVTVCSAQCLWLFKNQKLNRPIKSRIRLLDVVSLLVGLFFMTLYWLTLAWLINDVLAVCTIVACIKILKIRSLKVGVCMLFSLLFIEIVAGLIVHYIIGVSYNNLVIQLFQSPLVIVFPSITPELYRQCAWLPVTSIIFPGMFISYLRRFDKSRGTLIYIVIGYISFYIGSIIWMICDISTTHSLPLAIINDPTVTLIVVFFANRRNELETIWSGMFYDPQLPDFSQDMLPNHYSNLDRQSNKDGGRYTIGLQKITEDIKVQELRSEQI